jgi:hypothetical protein
MRNNAAWHCRYRGSQKELHSTFDQNHQSLTTVFGQMFSEVVFRLPDYP